jgi:hypothetical protein
MGKNKLKKRRARQHAMWLIAHIRGAGAQPLPFEQNGYRSYLSNLQRQYNTIRAGMDRESQRQARLAGRALVRLNTLEGVAADVMPIDLPPAVQSSRTTVARYSVHDSTSSGIPAPAPPGATAPLSSPKKRDVWNCRRKLRHVDHLSALLHLVRLGDPDMHAYRCSVCFGIHVGHDPDRVSLRTLSDEVTSIEARLAALTVEHSQLQERRISLLNLRERLLNDAVELDEDCNMPSLPEA